MKDSTFQYSPLSGLPKNQKLSTLAVFLCMLLGPSLMQAQEVRFDNFDQGDGNKGALFIPVDVNGTPANFSMTARYRVDKHNPFGLNAGGWSGTVDVIGNRGVGAQTFSGSHNQGSHGPGLFGSAYWGYQELTFAMNQPTELQNISLELNEINFGSGPGSFDDLVIFIQTNSAVVTIMEGAIQSAFTSLGNERGNVDFTSFASNPLLTPETHVQSVTYRQLRGTAFVFAANVGAIPAQPVDTPEPATIVVMSTFLALAAKKKYSMKKKH